MCHRPEWVKQAPHMKGQYDRLLELEQGVNELAMEHEERDPELMSELLELAVSGDQRLHEAVERAQQERVDARVKQMLAERKLRDAELRRKMDELGDSVGTALDNEAQRESRTGVEEYMASIRERVRVR